MRPVVRAPFTFYCEERVQKLAEQFEGQVIQTLAGATAVSSFINDVWQSAKREGYVEGHVRAQTDLIYGEEPPASVLGEWRKRAARKSMDS
jgi:hypothetical protein